MVVLRASLVTRGRHDGIFAPGQTKAIFLSDPIPPVPLRTANPSPIVSKSNGVAVHTKTYSMHGHTSKRTFHMPIQQTLSPLGLVTAAT